MRLVMLERAKPSSEEQEAGWDGGAASLKAALRRPWRDPVISSAQGSRDPILPGCPRDAIIAENCSGLIARNLRDDCNMIAGRLCGAVRSTF